jgi:hypothetical protein
MPQRDVYEAMVKHPRRSIASPRTPAPMLPAHECGTGPTSSGTRLWASLTGSGMRLCNKSEDPIVADCYTDNNRKPCANLRVRVLIGACDGNKCCRAVHANSTERAAEYLAFALKSILPARSASTYCSTRSSVLVDATSPVSACSIASGETTS